VPPQLWTEIGKSVLLRKFSLPKIPSGRSIAGRYPIFALLPNYADSISSNLAITQLFPHLIGNKLHQSI
jgi:hypothetical protein